MRKEPRGAPQDPGGQLRRTREEEGMARPVGPLEPKYTRGSFLGD